MEQPSRTSRFFDNKHANSSTDHTGHRSNRSSDPADHCSKGAVQKCANLVDWVKKLFACKIFGTAENDFSEVLERNTFFKQKNYYMLLLLISSAGSCSANVADQTIDVRRERFKFPCSQLCGQLQRRRIAQESVVAGQPCVYQ